MDHKFSAKKPMTIYIQQDEKYQTKCDNDIARSVASNTIQLHDV